MYQISLQKPADVDAIEGLMAEAFGAARYARSVWQLRPGPAVDWLCFVARDGDEIVGSLRFWQVKLGDEMVLLLGPLAVLPALRGKGCGRALVETGLNQAKNGPWRLVLVSGEVDYYPKFGFVPARSYNLVWPGFVEMERLQFYELQSGALASLPEGPLIVAPS
jgi:predicted N-acetyltransferase YhbS